MHQVPTLPIDGLRGGSVKMADETESEQFRLWVVRRNMARQQMRRLSQRELQVVQLVSDGQGNREIAEILE
ncbi:MAG: hypothetical protein KDA85_05440, partial [Planctomycetaceae bacterium]|nr:hypothetical protein [Planctomycetaceae bacterium]